MNETSKCHSRRLNSGEFDRYLRGKGIDIGAGADPLKPPYGTVRIWDRDDGDAAELQGIDDATFDFVYSSHCLEHMVDVASSIRNWIRVLKPAGWLYIVVPDFCLYEKLQWPSRYNGDHKATFSLDIPRVKTGRDTHFQIYQDLLPILRGLGMRLEVARLEDDGFDYANGQQAQTLTGAMAQICIILQRIPAYTAGQASS
jgi:SAM-dependent methyltransferase